MASELIFKVFGEGANLYEILGIAPQATEDEIRKAYRKKALKFHPDKCPGDNDASEKFQALSAVHSILSDSTKRQLYDNTGDVDASDLSQSEREWYDYWRAMFPIVTPDQIDQFSTQYKGSDEEKQDVLQAYTEGEGDMQYILDNVMLAETEEDEQRFRAIIDEAIATETVPKLKKYRKQKKPSRNAGTKRRNEAKEAEEMLQKMTGGGGLEALIRSRQSQRAGDLLSRLEAKYSAMDNDDYVVNFDEMDEEEEDMEESEPKKRSKKAKKKSQKKL